jgi:hypothetical protein
MILTAFLAILAETDIIERSGGTTMPQPVIEKTELLERMQAGYAQFEALLTSLKQEQMTIPGVNGNWSIKDHIAHLLAWQDHLQELLQAVLDGKKEPPKPEQEFSTVDEINEYIYQKHKDRSLAEVLAAFRASYQRVLSTVQALSQESLNAPFPWYEDDNPIGPLAAGDTYQHYEEHRSMIQRWLQR